MSRPAEFIVGVALSGLAFRLGAQLGINAFLWSRAPGSLWH